MEFTKTLLDLHCVGYIKLKLDLLTGKDLSSLTLFSAPTGKPRIDRTNLKKTVIKVGAQHLFDVDITGDPLPTNTLTLNDVVSLGDQNMSYKKIKKKKYYVTASSFLVDFIIKE